jgi:hypothetical protein
MSISFIIPVSFLSLNIALIIGIIKLIAMRNFDKKVLKVASHTSLLVFFTEASSEI